MLRCRSGPCSVSLEANLCAQRTPGPVTRPDIVFYSFRHGTVGRMRAAGIGKGLGMVVISDSAVEDAHGGYAPKNNFSIADRKRVLDAFKFDDVLGYDAWKELRLCWLTCVEL
jgi:hypothetical protein